MIVRSGRFIVHESNQTTEETLALERKQKLTLKLKNKITAEKKKLIKISIPFF